MKKIFLLFAFLNFHLPFLFAQKDSVSIPSLKIFIEGSLSLINGWTATTGKLYSTDWHGSSEANTHSKGFGYGLLISKRVARKFYVSAGFDKSEEKYDKFRKTPYPASPVLYDTSYYGYKLKTFRIPVFIQIPLLIRRARLFLCAGVENEFTYSEYWHATYADYSSGYGNRFEESFIRSVTRYTGTKFYAALDFEFKNTEGPILFLLGVDYRSPTIISKATGSYFLQHGSMFLLRMGFGFSFGKKKPQQIQFT
ncbi:MAG: hypothetical protein ABI763_10375 [Bacteroidota bacterium]